MDEDTIDLRKLANMLIKHLRGICIITGAFVLIAIIYLFRASSPPPMYESDSLLRIKPPKALGVYLLHVGTGDSTNMTAQIISTDAEILKSRSVIEPVIMATEPVDKDGNYLDYDTYVKERIVTTPFKNTEILKLSVIAERPETAQKANKLIVQGFLERLRELSRNEQRITKNFVAVDMATAKDRLSVINKQLGGAGAATADSANSRQYNDKLAELEMTRIGYLDKYTENHPVIKDLDGQIVIAKKKVEAMTTLEQAKVAEVMVSNEVQLVDAASLPVKPLAVKTRKSVLTPMLFLILGLMTGCGYAIACEILNRKICKPEDVQNFLNLPVLGSIPDIASMYKVLADKREKPSLCEKIRRLLQK